MSAEPAASVIAPGTPVPDFTLRGEDGEAFTQADLRGQTSVLVFYPFAFSPVCTDQLHLYEEVLEEFTRARRDPLRRLVRRGRIPRRAFREKLGVTIEQLSDFEPKGETCRAFGVLPSRRVSRSGRW